MQCLYAQNIALVSVVKLGFSFCAHMQLISLKFQGEDEYVLADFLEQLVGCAAHRV